MLNKWKHMKSSNIKVASYEAEKTSPWTRVFTEEV